MKRVTLTPMEVRVIADLATDGAPSKVVADRLGVSREAVDAHASRAMRKLGCQTRASLVIWWLRVGQELLLPEDRVAA